jgi:peptide/nickel transport system substrate-binding protein
MRNTGMFAGIMIFMLMYSNICISGTMKYAESVEPQTLNPLNMIDAVSFRFSNLLYNSLMCIDIDMIPAPELLDSDKPVAVSNDNKVYTFRLRDDVVWHDGVPFTAQDVEFTFRMVKDTRTDTNLGWIRDAFVDVSATGTYTVKFILNRSASLDELLGRFFFKIIPAHLFPKDKEYISVYDDFGKKTVCGTGPYVFRKWIPGKGIKLVRNNKYFKPFRKLVQDSGDTGIDTIIMKYMRDPRVQVESLLNPEGIHLIPVVSPVYYPEIRGNEYCDLIRYNSRKFAYFAYNCKHKFFKDVRVRLALTYATNREAMIEKVYGVADMDKTQIMSGPYLPGEGDPNVVPVPYDPQKAIQLLIEVGFNDSDGDGILEKDGEEFEVSLKTYVQDECLRRVCILYQADLLKIGVKLKGGKIEFMEMNKWMQEVFKERDFDITFGTWMFHEDTDIVDNLFSSTAAISGGNNFVSYINPKVERLLSINRYTFDGEIIRKNKYELHRIIRNDCPYTFLFTLPAYAGVRSSTLKGVTIHPCYFFGYITEWYMKELF